MSPCTPLFGFNFMYWSTEDTNCDFNNSFNFETVGGASQGILGNPAYLLSDLAGTNSTHHIWKWELDLKQCDIFPETGDLPAPDTPWSLLYYVIFSILLCNEELCLWTQGEALCEHLRSAHRPDTYIRLTGCQELWGSANTRSTTKHTRNRENPLTEPKQTRDLSSVFINSRKIHAVLLSLILLSVLWLGFL